jgi:hypothetical protein
MGSQRNGLINVSTAFMKLFATQPVAARIETGRLPKLPQYGPRISSSSPLIAIKRLDNQTHAGAFRKNGPLVGLKHTVFEGCCYDLEHTVTILELQIP